MTPVAAVPVELQTVPQPAYAVAAPDRVFVQVIVAPKPAPENYGIQPGDVLSVEVFPAAQQPAIFTAPTLLVAPDGKIRIAHYGELKVAGNNLDQIADQIKTLLREHPDIQALAPRVNLQLAYLHDPLDLLTGDRLIRPDGTVNLSPYGDLFVQGMTLPQIREAVRKQILKERPDLAPRLASSDEMYIDVEVTGFNSQVCYVQEEIAQPSLQPITGTETVLDVVVRSGSATELAERNDVYLVRVNPFEGHEPQILPVHLRDIIRCGDTSTNYQLRPGDRIVVPPRDVVVAQRFLAPFFQIADSMASTGLLWERLISNFRVDTTIER